MLTQVLGRTSCLLLVALVACGGRSERTPAAHAGGTAGAGLAGSGGTATDGSGGTATDGSGGTATDGSGGTATEGSGGTAPDAGGVDATTGGAGGTNATGGSSGTTAAGGTGGSGTSEAGAAPIETSEPFGDFDQPFMGAPPPGGTSFYSSFGLGNWFIRSSSGHVGDAPVSDIVPPRGSDTKALHVSGADYGVWVDVYAQLNHPGNKPVDLSGFSGLSFWARLTGNSSTIILVMNDGSFVLPNIDAIAMLPSGAFVATDEWQEFAFDFDPARVSSVVSIDFVVQGGGDALDFWLDQMTLVCRGACQ